MYLGTIFFKGGTQSTAYFENIDGSTRYLCLAKAIY